MNPIGKFLIIPCSEEIEICLFNSAIFWNSQGKLGINLRQFLRIFRISIRIALQ
jgi:hypothetical protein